MALREETINTDDVKAFYGIIVEKIRMWFIPSIANEITELLNSLIQASYTKCGEKMDSEGFHELYTALINKIYASPTKSSSKESRTYIVQVFEMFVKTLENTAFNQSNQN
jgi:hypothetical protein